MSTSARGAASDVREGVAQDEGVRVDGERVHARLREVEHELHLVQAELAEGVRAPSVVVGREARVDQEGTGCRASTAGPRSAFSSSAPRKCGLFSAIRCFTKVYAKSRRL